MALLPSELTAIKGYLIVLFFCPLACCFLSCFVIWWWCVYISISSNDATASIYPPSHQGCAAPAKYALPTTISDCTQSTHVAGVNKNLKGENTESVGSSKNRRQQQGSHWATTTAKLQWGRTTRRAAALHSGKGHGPGARAAGLPSFATLCLSFPLCEAGTMTVPLIRLLWRLSHRAQAELRAVPAHGSRWSVRPFINGAVMILWRCPVPLGGHCSGFPQWHCSLTINFELSRFLLLATEGA